MWRKKETSPQNAAVTWRNIRDVILPAGRNKLRQQINSTVVTEQLKPARRPPASPQLPHTGAETQLYVIKLGSLLCRRMSQGNLIE